MQINIFDVEHGFCGLVRDPNGKALLIDCGHNATTGFYPGNFLLASGIKTVDLFIPLNYDEDHVSGLPDLRSKVWIAAVQKNGTISPERLRAIKQAGGQLRAGVTSLLDVLGTYTQEVAPPTNLSD